jgi:peptide chain release factor 1
MASNEKLASKLQTVLEKYDRLTAEMNDPAVASNGLRLVAAAKEHSSLARVAQPYRQYLALQEQMQQAGAMAADSGADAEMKNLAEEEVRQLQAQSQALMDEIQDRLVMSDKDQIESVIMEIRAGTGGEEAALFAGDLMNMYLHYADRKGWKVEMMSSSSTDLGGFREVILSIKGEGVYHYLSHEGGGHRVQRVPQTETQGRIHTSAATVAVLPEPRDVEIEINWEKDVLEHTSRAGGPGGQSVNKVESAIRLEHIPTGITVSMRDEKSQHKNRAKARRILATRVHEHFLNKQLAQEAAARKSMIGSGDRSQRIRTYNFPQNRCTDHRLKGGPEGANFNLQTIMAGDLNEMISGLIALERAERLAHL